MINRDGDTTLQATVAQPNIYDQQVTYMRLWARMMGVDDVRRVETTQGDPAETRSRRDKSIAESL